MARRPTANDPCQPLQRPGPDLVSVGALRGVERPRSQSLDGPVERGHPESGSRDRHPLRPAHELRLVRRRGEDAWERGPAHPRGLWAHLRRGPQRLHPAPRGRLPHRPGDSASEDGLPVRPPPIQSQIRAVTRLSLGCGESVARLASTTQDDRLGKAEMRPLALHRTHATDTPAPGIAPPASSGQESMTQRQVIRRAPRRRAVSGCGRAVLIGAALWLVSASPAAADTPLRWDVVVSNASGSPIRLFQTENESCWEDSVTGSFIGLPLGTVFAGGETRTVQTRANNSFGCTFLKNFRD